jgi:hypothetical protein
MATQVLVRQLDANHDPIYGNGQADFLVGIYAVAQIIQTALLLFEGEWWAQLNEGLPLFQSILGAAGAGKNPEAVSLVIQNRILGITFQGTQLVISLSNINTSYNPVNRAFQFNCNANTIFGTIAVSFQPGASAALPT